MSAFRTLEDHDNPWSGRSTHEAVDRGKTKALVAVSAALLSSILAGCALPRAYEKQHRPEDLATTAMVEERLREHPDLGPPNELHVETRDQVVYLTGLASAPLAGESAAALAREVPGVTKVVNSVALQQ